MFNIHPVSLFKALSLALELSKNGLSRHHLRTAMIANTIAGELGLDELERQVLFYAGLLHDIGAASSWEEKQKLCNIACNSSIHNHAKAGYELLKDSPQLGILAETILYHHTSWDGSNGSMLSGEDIPITSRIINIADRLEVLIKDNVDIFKQKDEIIAVIDKGSGVSFDPKLVRVLKDISARESFWLDITNRFQFQDAFKNSYMFGRMQFDIDDIVNIAEIFATIIDRTSSYTAAHSVTVSKVASLLAKIRGFSETEIKSMRIAGLLHDIGKLAVPNEILEKPGKLTPEEFVIIKKHTYYTYHILNQIEGCSIIAEWAAYHHETLDGNGYPFHIKGQDLRLGSRIVAVADVFAALTEIRPYRQALSLLEVEKIMRDMVERNKLDSRIVNDLFAHSKEAYEVLHLATEEIKKLHSY